MRRARMRVALDTTFAGVNPTGVGLYSRKLAEHLAAISAERRIKLKCFGPSCKQGANHSLLDITQEWPIYTQAVLPLLMRMHRRKPHVVHSTSHLGPLWGPGRLVVTVHDLIFRRYPQEYDPIWLAITKTLLPHVLRRADAIIADSHVTKADIARYYGFAKRKVRVIYPGINSEYAEIAHMPDDAKALLDGAGVDGDPYILCLGPWVNRKNLGVVVSAFALLAHDLPHVRLVITGSTPRGMKGETPAHLIGRLPPELRNRVHLVGYVSSDYLRILLQNAMLLAYPSRYEGFGLPPLEAMSAGVPVVASRTPAVAEVTGGAALYASPDDPREWREYFLQVAASPEQAASLKKAGKERSALFSWERCAHQTADLYEVLSAELLVTSDQLPVAGRQ